MIAKLKTVKEKVKLLLENNEALRDDDEKLLATYWYKELGGKETVFKFTAHDLLEKIALRKITTADTITRMRVLVQKENTNLQGKNYKKRKKIQEKVRKTIHEV